MTGEAKPLDVNAFLMRFGLSVEQIRKVYDQRFVQRLFVANL